MTKLKPGHYKVCYHGHTDIIYLKKPIHIYVGSIEYDVIFLTKEKQYPYPIYQDDIVTPLTAKEVQKYKLEKL